MKILLLFNFNYNFKKGKNSFVLILNIHVVGYFYNKNTMYKHEFLVLLSYNWRHKFKAATAARKVCEI